LPLSKERKSEILNEYIQKLKECSGIIVTEYRGMSVSKFQGLRTKLREKGATYNVTKNTLFRIALKQLNMACPEDLLKGPIAVVFASHEHGIAGAAQILLDSKKDLDLLQLKGAIIEKDVFGATDMEALSKLPTLSEIRSQIAGMVVQPASQLLSLLEATQRDLVSVLQAYLDKQGEAA
jgi:large subunit ribosomal protein L10